MRLDFNILWIEDQPARIGSYKERLDREAKKEGFKINVIQAPSFEVASQYLAPNGELILDDIDMVLVDYDLGSGSGGERVIKDIRDRVPYKEIIFYSAIAPADLKRKVLEQGVEGVFCSSREELSETMIGVFQALVKKALDLDNCRGIVMGATSDIDHIVMDCLHALDAQLDSAHRQTALTQALDNIDKRLSDLKAFKELVDSGSPVTELVIYLDLLQSSDRVRLLRNLIGLHFNNGHSELRNALGKYVSDVMPTRNKLGHVRLTVQGSVRKLAGEQGAEITISQLKQLRQQLVEYRDHFEELPKIVRLK